MVPDDNYDPRFQDDHWNDYFLMHQDNPIHTYTNLHRIGKNLLPFLMPFCLFDL